MKGTAGGVGTPQIDDDQWQLDRQIDRPGGFDWEQITMSAGVRGFPAPSLFDFVDSPTVSIVDAATGARTVLRARDAVTQATVDYVNETGAICNEWLAGAVNVSDGSVEDYRNSTVNSSINWVLEEFFMTNWYEGYEWSD